MLKDALVLQWVGQDADRARGVEIVAWQVSAGGSF